jgi:beta-fructofuranosidase
MLIYTTVGPGERGNRPPNAQWAALGSDDWMVWEKHPENPILSLETHGGPPYEGPWRDPFVFETEEGRFLVLGGDYDDVTSVALYEAEDDSYARWRYRGEIAKAPRTGPTFLECPNFFWVDGQWVLLTSPYRPVEYQVGDFDPAACTFTPATSGVLDAGWRPDFTISHYYATNIAYAPDGRCIVFGWVRGFPQGKGWNGCLALPRVLTIGPDRRPRQNPVAELEELRGRAVSFPATDLLAGTTVVATALTPSAEIDVTLLPAANSTVELTLRGQVEGAPSLSLRYDGRELQLSHTVVPLGLEPGAPLRLRLFVDRSVVELYVGEGEIAITTVEELPIGLVDVEITSLTAGTRLVSFAAWDMMPTA